MSREVDWVLHPLAGPGDGAVLPLRAPAVFRRKIRALVQDLRSE